MAFDWSPREKLLWADENHDAGLDLIRQAGAAAERPARGLRGQLATLGNALGRPGQRGRLFGAALGGIALANSVLLGPYLVGAGVLFRTPPPQYTAVAPDDSDFRPYREPGQPAVGRTARPGTATLPPQRITVQPIPGYVRALVADATADADAARAARRSAARSQPRPAPAAPRTAPRQALAPHPAPEVRELPEPEGLPRQEEGPRPAPAPAPRAQPAPTPPAPADRNGPADPDPDPDPQSSPSPSPSPTPSPGEPAASGAVPLRATGAADAGFAAGTPLPPTGAPEAESAARLATSGPADVAPGADPAAAGTPPPRR